MSLRMAGLVRWLVLIPIAFLLLVSLPPERAWTIAALMLVSYLAGALERHEP